MQNASFHYIIAGDSVARAQRFGLEAPTSADEGERTSGLAALWSALLEEIPDSVVIIDREGNTILENAAARQFLERYPELQRRAGRLWIPRVHRYLDGRYLFEQARLARRSHDSCPARSVAFRLPDDEETEPAFVEARGLDRGTAISQADAPHFWLLSLYSPTSAKLPSSRALQRLLGLTPAEALLVQALFGGQGLSQAAIALAISRETAKTQLRCIFRKCRVQSQAQLMRLIATGPFFAAPERDSDAQPGRSWPLPRTTYL